MNESPAYGAADPRRPPPDPITWLDRTGNRRGYGVWVRIMEINKYYVSCTFLRPIY